MLVTRIAILVTILAVPVAAADGPAAKAPDEKAYVAVDAAIRHTLTAIRGDLVKLNDAGTFPQLSGIDASEIRSIDIDWKETSLHHRKAATWVAGDEFKIGKDGCRIMVNLRSYDAESDPRFGTGAASASPGPHFEVVATGVPFGIRVTVEAEATAAGKAFKKRVNDLITGHVDQMKEDLGARPVSWSALVDRDAPLKIAELEEEAFVVLEGTILELSEEVYEEIGHPKRLQVKVTAILQEKAAHKGRLKIGDQIPVDTWKLDRAVELRVGSKIRGYLGMGHTVHGPNDLRPFYHPVARNAIKVSARAR